MANYKYLDLTGLQLFASKINDRFTASAVTVTQHLTQGTKIATIKVGETSTDLYCETNTDTTYTFKDGTDGSFTVTPLNGSAQTVSIGKPATSGHADTASAANKLSVSDIGTDTKPVKFENGVPVAVNNDLATKQSVDDLQTLVKSLAGADFLEYRGTVGSDAELKAAVINKDPKNGWVYIANGSWEDPNGKYGHVESGDLLIASGEENSDGFLENINWNVVQTNIHNAVSGNGLTTDYLVLGNNERNVKISGIKAYQNDNDNKWYLDGFDETVSAQLAQNQEVSKGDVAFLISVDQTDARLSGGTCATMKRITDKEIEDLW